jgi:hypothetical protein
LKDFVSVNLIHVCFFFDPTGSLPDALLTECSKCSEKQRDGTERVIKFLIEKKPEQWTSLQAKYDPENVYQKRYKAEAEKSGIAI